MLAVARVGECDGDHDPERESGTCAADGCARDELLSAAGRRATPQPRLSVESAVTSLVSIDRPRLRPVAAVHLAACWNSGSERTSNDRSLDLGLEEGRRGGASVLREDCPAAACARVERVSLHGSAGSRAFQPWNRRLLQELHMRRVPPNEQGPRRQFQSDIRSNDLATSRSNGPHKGEMGGSSHPPGKG
jgi:hypothetical protein